MKFSKLLAPALILTTACIGHAPLLADAKPGVDAWSQGNYETAVKLWRGPAAAGNADAQFNLGQAYKLGRGVPMDLQQAEFWYKKAADQGHLQAADNYGLILFSNNRRDEALPFLRASAERGEPRSQYVLGTAHFNGDFVEKDWVRAYALMTRASTKGLDAAKRNLTQMDQYVPIEQRQKGVELAGQMEQAERRSHSNQMAGLRPAPSTGPVQTAQLPPSQVAPPAPPAANPPGVSYPAPVPQAPSPAPAPRPAPPPVVASAPAPAASGNWRIQLGAFSQQSRAKSLWSQLEGRVSGLSGLQPYLVEAGSVTRLQAGPFATKSAAEAQCVSVRAAGNACIVKAR